MQLDLYTHLGHEKNNLCNIQTGIQALSNHELPSSAPEYRPRSDSARSARGFFFSDCQPASQLYLFIDSANQQNRQSILQRQITTGKLSIQANHTPSPPCSSWSLHVTTVRIRSTLPCILHLSYSPLLFYRNPLSLFLLQLVRTLVHIRGSYNY